VSEQHESVPINYKSGERAYNDKWDSDEKNDKDKENYRKNNYKVETKMGSVIWAVR